MKKFLSVLVVIAFMPQGHAALSLGSTAEGGYFYGGGIGAGFGNSQSYFEFSPMIGKHLTETVSAGVGLSYRYTSDKTKTPKLSSEDYGANLFTRYRLGPSLFLEGDVEYLNYELLYASGVSERRDFTSVLAGGGMIQPIGGNTSFYASALYNLMWEEKDSPYSDPWVVRFGVAVGF